jgi:leucyl/phenylalanyl-tRNA--protein transferase
MISPDLLLRAYASGWFPMAEDRASDAEIEWFSPDPRGILPLDGFRIPARLARTMRSGRFRVTVDTAFERVIRACAERDETWINGAIFDSYLELARLGFAHSVEAWLGDELAGGLYGVSLRGAFFGESMFHTVTDASKVALVTLVERLRANGFVLLDVQWVTPHLAQFGAVAISRRRYLRLLGKSLAVDCRFSGDTQEPETRNPPTTAGTG